MKTNAQRREVARLRLQAALLQQEADELRRQARRQARQGMTSASANDGANGQLV